MPVLMATNAAHKLVEIVESTPGPLKMPKMVMLVKQLKKELNITKSMKEEHRRVGECCVSILLVHRGHATGIYYVFVHSLNRLLTLSLLL